VPGDDTCEAIGAAALGLAAAITVDVATTAATTPRAPTDRRHLRNIRAITSIIRTVQAETLRSE
jgi:hypothetical protein